MSEGPTGYTAYSYTGWGAAHGEQQKRDSWRWLTLQATQEGTMLEASLGSTTPMHT